MGTSGASARRFFAATARLRALPASIWATISFGFITPASMWPPISAVVTSPPELNGTYLTLTFAACSKRCVKMWSSVKVAVPPIVSPAGLARAALTKSSMVWWGLSERTEIISSSIATIIRLVIASRWSPGSRPSILPETMSGVAPATTFESPFLFIR